MNNVVQIRNVSRSYMLGGQQVNALKNITLDIEDGVFIAIAGPSGSGKSTQGIVEAYGDAAHFIDGDEVDVRWRAMTSDDLLHFDFSYRTIWLNTRYRDALNCGAGADDNDDAPLLKSMLLLFYGVHFTGARPGPKERADQRVWLQLLTAAAHAEERRYRQQTKGMTE